jgi:hypothetical protein
MSESPASGFLKKRMIILPATLILVIAVIAIISGLVSRPTRDHRSYHSSRARMSLPTCLLALQILDRLNSGSVPNPPSLLTIFRLYCAQRLTVTQVARHCGCSLGTVSNRLRLMHSIIGIHPSRIRNAPRPGDSYPLSPQQFETQKRG